MLVNSAHILSLALKYQDFASIMYFFGHPQEVDSIIRPFHPGMK